MTSSLSGLSRVRGTTDNNLPCLCCICCLSCRFYLLTTTGTTENNILLVSGLLPFCKLSQVVSPLISSSSVTTRDSPSELGTLLSLFRQLISSSSVTTRDSPSELGILLSLFRQLSSRINGMSEKGQTITSHDYEHPGRASGMSEFPNNHSAWCHRRENAVEGGEVLQP